MLWKRWRTIWIKREEVPVVDESTMGDTKCLMSTVVDGSSGNAEVFPMTDDAAGHVPREPRVQLERRMRLHQSPNLSIMMNRT